MEDATEKTKFAKELSQAWQRQLSTIFLQNPDAYSQGKPIRIRSLFPMHEVNIFVPKASDEIQSTFYVQVHLVPSFALGAWFVTYAIIPPGDGAAEHTLATVTIAAEAINSPLALSQAVGRWLDLILYQTWIPMTILVGRWRQIIKNAAADDQIQFPPNAVGQGD